MVPTAIRETAVSKEARPPISETLGARLEGLAGQGLIPSINKGEPWQMGPSGALTETAKAKVREAYKELGEEGYSSDEILEGIESVRGELRERMRHARGEQLDTYKRTIRELSDRYKEGRVQLSEEYKKAKGKAAKTEVSARRKQLQASNQQERSQALSKYQADKAGSDPVKDINLQRKLVASLERTVVNSQVREIAQGITDQHLATVKEELVAVHNEKLRKKNPSITDEELRAAEDTYRAKLNKLNTGLLRNAYAQHKFKEKKGNLGEQPAAASGKAVATEMPSESETMQQAAEANRRIAELRSKLGDNSRLLRLRRKLSYGVEGAGRLARSATKPALRSLAVGATGLAILYITTGGDITPIAKLLRMQPPPAQAQELKSADQEPTQPISPVIDIQPVAQPTAEVTVSPSSEKPAPTQSAAELQAQQDKKKIEERRKESIKFFGGEQRLAELQKANKEFQKAADKLYKIKVKGLGGEVFEIPVAFAESSGYQDVNGQGPIQGGRASGADLQARIDGLLKDPKILAKIRTREDALQFTKDYLIATDCAGLVGDIARDVLPAWDKLIGIPEHGNQGATAILQAGKAEKGGFKVLPDNVDNIAVPGRMVVFIEPKNPNEGGHVMIVTEVGVNNDDDPRYPGFPYIVLAQNTDVVAEKGKVTKGANHVRMIVTNPHQSLAKQEVQDNVYDPRQLGQDNPELLKFIAREQGVNIDGLTIDQISALPQLQGVSYGVRFMGQGLALIQVEAFDKLSNTTSK